MKLVVYSAVFGGYDAILPPRRPLPGVDYVCFTDSSAAAIEGWTAGAIPAEVAALSPASSNRWLKMHPHRLFRQHDASVYVDGNIEVIGDVAELARSAIAVAPLSMYDHPFRDCLYDEALACAWIGLDWLEPIARQMARYSHDGFPRKAGLFEANVIVRAHHDPHVIRAMERWWREWTEGIKRDQLSLTYALWREDLAPRSLGQHDPRFVHRYFVYRRHRQPMRGLPLRLIRRYLNRAHVLLTGGWERAIKLPASAA